MEGMAYARGRLAEVRAEQLLLDKGFTILARNYRIPGAEIDLIARKDRLIVFAEVKLRTGSGTYGRAAVTAAKQQRISKGALGYLARHGLMDRQARFDVIEIQDGRITHIENAFPYQGPMF